MADEPLDTLEQVIAFRLNPRFVHSCCDPKEKEVAGCPVAHLCDLPEKNRGPLLLGVRIMKPMLDGGVGVKQEIMKCHTFIHQRDNLMDNGGAIDIIARHPLHEGCGPRCDRGEEIEVPESERILDPTVEGGVRYEFKPRMRKVPYHLRLKDLPRYRNRLVLLDKRQQLEEREKRERGARMLGMSPEEAGVSTTHQPQGSAGGVRGNKAVP